MARFEVFIPAANKNAVNTTLRVTAENWMAALKAGLTKLGESGAATTDALCDIKDDGSIHVTDAKSGRVFRIKDLDGTSLASNAPPAAATIAEVRPVATAPSSGLGDFQEAKATQLDTRPVAPAAPRAVPAQAAPAPAAKKAVTAPAVKPAVPARRPSAEAQKVESVPRPSDSAVEKMQIGRGKKETSLTDEALADLFLNLPDINGMKREEALYLLLDVALDKTASEAGSIWIASLNSDGLTLGAARGPKAKELLGLGVEVAVGVGIVGFCAQEGVTLAVSDVQRDPRWHRAISDRIGYETKALLCAPIMSDGQTLGAVQLINRKTGSAFSSAEISIAHFIANQAAVYLAAHG